MATKEKAAGKGQSALMDALEKRLMPMATVVGGNKYLLTLRDIFATMMPMLIVGSIFTLVQSFPIPAWTAFLKATVVGDTTLSALLGVPATVTVSMIALFAAFLMGYNFAEYEDLKDRVSAGLTSLLSWLMLIPLFTEYTPKGSEEVFRVSSIPFEWVGSKGVFVAIVVGFLSIKIYGALVHKKVTIKMPDGVPPTVSRAFSALIPMTATILVIWLIRVAFVMTPWDNIFSFIYAFLQLPLQNLGGTVVAQSLVYLFAHVLWFFGIHGTNITDAVYHPILLTLSIENLEATTAGLPVPNLINSQFQNLFATQGGGGSTLALLIAILLFCKSKRLVQLGRLCIAPGLFNINEPVIFGLPIVLNPVLFIPFVLTPLFNIITTWAVMVVGLVPYTNGIQIPWTTPTIISGFLVSGWQGAVWQAVMLVCGVLIYLPFIKTLDREYLEEEAVAADVTEAKAASDIDDVDLDNIDLDF